MSSEREEPRQILDDCKDAILEDILYKLKRVDKEDTEEIDFHDIVHENVDNAISRLDRTEQMSIVDYFGGEETIDTGLVDTSSLDKMIATTSYAVLEQELFEDNFFVEDLQMAFNNEIINYQQAQEWIKKIEFVKDGNDISEYESEEEEEEEEKKYSDEVSTQ